MEDQISEMSKKVSYVDEILNRDDLTSITSIALDYGMSAIALNKKLNELGVQHKVSGQWILNMPHLTQGYARNRTYSFKHKDGTPGIRNTTEWTQKGRLFLYNFLKDRGILPKMEQDHQ